MYIIVIFMFMSLNTQKDALSVTHLDGKPLEFKKVEHCYQHVRENLDELKALAEEHFGDVPIKQIDCFHKLPQL